MSDTAAALAFLAVMAGTAVEPPKVVLSEVSGEIRITAPKYSPSTLPELPLGSRIWVVSGYARLETDLPGTIWLGEGDGALIAASPEVREGSSGLTVRALAPGRARADFADAMVLLEAGEEASFAKAGEGRVSVTAKAGVIELSGQGWRDELLQGESLGLRAEPTGFEGSAVEMSEVTTRLEEGESSLSLTISSPQQTLAEAARAVQSGFRAEETDLRSAAAGLPRKSDARRASYARTLTEAEAAAVEQDRVVAAFAVAVMLMAGWWWARRVA